jgi:hypothetical protein
MMSCCVKNMTPCIAQGADKDFEFRDNETVDLSSASEASFSIWRRNISGALLFSATLANSKLVFVNDYTLRATVTGAESLAFPSGSHHCELWVTMAGGEKYLLAAGRFKVTDTRKHDA